jgi:hypothetical protein
VTERSVWLNTGPVPVRDVVGRPGGEREAEAQPAEAASDVQTERTFVAAGEHWLARLAGSGCYGTGRRGSARLVAVHFYRAEAPGDPLREALIPAAAFDELRSEEWVAVWSRATPIESGS